MFKVVSSICKSYPRSLLTMFINLFFRANENLAFTSEENSSLIIPTMD